MTSTETHTSRRSEGRTTGSDTGDAGEASVGNSRSAQHKKAPPSPRKTPDSTRYRKKWSDAEDAVLKECAGAMSMHKIARKLGRTTKGCKQRLSSLGLSQTDAQGRFTLPVIAAALGLTVREVVRWQGLGFKFCPGPTCRTGRECLMVDIDKMEPFLARFPEAIDLNDIRPKMLREIGVEVERLYHRWTVKKMRCNRADRHPTRTAIEWWAPFNDPRPTCPCCARRMTRWAHHGDGVRQGTRRYRDEAPIEDPIIHVNLASAALLAALVDGEWLLFREVAAAAFPAPRQHHDCLLLRGLKRLLRHGFVASRGAGGKADPMQWQITSDGLVVLARIQALQSGGDHGRADRE